MPSRLLRSKRAGARRTCWKDSCKPSLRSTANLMELENTHTCTRQRTSHNFTLRSPKPCRTISVPWGPPRLQCLQAPTSYLVGAIPNLEGSIPASIRGMYKIAQRLHRCRQHNIRDLFSICSANGGPRLPPPWENPEILTKEPPRMGPVLPPVAIWSRMLR